MKRTFIIRNVIIAIVIIAVIIGIGMYFWKNTDRDYEIEKVENYNYFVLRQENLLGVIDRSGNIIINPEYDDIKIPNPEKPIFACYKNSEVKMLDEKNQELYTQYGKVEPIRLRNIASNLMYEKSILKYEENGKFGIITLEGKKILKPTYDEIEGLPYKEGELLVKQNDKYGVINIKGKELVNAEYDNIVVDAYHTSGNGYKFAGYIVSNKTQEGYRYGYVDYKGKTTLPTEYNEISRITDVKDRDNVYLIVAKNGQYGVINNNEELIKNEYQSISYDETNQLLTIEKSKKYGIATLEGKTIIPEEYDEIDITGIYVYAKKGKETIVYNSNGEKVKADANIAILKTDNDKYRIKLDTKNITKYGVIGENGEQIIEEKYNYIEYLYEDFFIVSNEKSKLGILDSKGNEKIKIENDLLQKIEGSDMIYTTDTATKTIALYSNDISKIYEMQNANIKITEKFIKIYNDEEIKYFNKENKEINASEAYPQNNLFAKQENGKWGFVDKEGKIVVEAKYDKVTEINEFGYAGVKKDGKWGVINAEGKEILEPTYELQEGIEPSFINTYYQVEYGFGEVYYTAMK